jgi:adenylosuccinate synthase
MEETAIQIDFQPQQGLEFIVNREPSIPEQSRYEVISNEEALLRHFHTDYGKVPVYVVVGGQKGDEGKGKETDFLMHIDPKITWVMATVGTHNAGKGVNTTNLHGNDVKVSLHLCPATLVDKNIHNYIGQNTKANLFKLEQEVLNATKATGRDQLGENYHLTVDLNTNLVLPNNRAEDIVGKINSQGSTVAGSTSSTMYVGDKKAPVLEDVLYNPSNFIKKVNYQLAEFADRLARDEELQDLGIKTVKDFGQALKNKELIAKNSRLRALATRVSKEEIDYFINDNPAEFLLEEYRKIIDSKIFNVGNVTDIVHEHIDNGEHGILEGVQSTLLSNRLKYSGNRTSGDTDGPATIAAAMLNHKSIDYKTAIVFKYGNTSVGGNVNTMSGFIRQGELSDLEVTLPSGEKESLELFKTIEKLYTSQEIQQYFGELQVALVKAINEGLSIKNTKVAVPKIDIELNLGQAVTIFYAASMREMGVTSNRIRTCRPEDEVETGVVYGVEDTNSKIAINALDRVLDCNGLIPVVEAYKVVEEYRDYDIGTIIKPGDPLLTEELTAECCIPVYKMVPSWSSMFTDGSNEPIIGKELHPNLASFIDMKTNGKDCFAIGYAPRTSGVCAIGKIE